MFKDVVIPRGWVEEMIVRKDRIGTDKKPANNARNSDMENQYDEAD